MPIYIGKPCIRCGSPERYEAHRDCVACQKRRVKEYRIKNADEISREKKHDYWLRKSRKEGNRYE